MQRKFWLIISVVAVVSALAIYLQQRYRIQPLVGPPYARHAHITRFHRANTERCDELIAGATGIIAVVEPVQDKPGERPSLMIQEVDMSWEEGLKRLAEIYSTRAEHLMVLVVNPNLDRNYRSQLKHQIEGTLEVDDACVVDPSHPPAWYPIPPTPRIRL